jgi:hypothetical protein
MKVIKLDRRHNLKRKGYDWAFRFQGWDPKANKVENAVKKLEGWRWDSTYWGKPTGRNSGRVYYVGVKNESTVTMVLLTMEN